MKKILSEEESELAELAEAEEIAEERHNEVVSAMKAVALQQSNTVQAIVGSAQVLAKIAEKDFNSDTTNLEKAVKENTQTLNKVLSELQKDVTVTIERDRQNLMTSLKLSRK
jgi:hypothetical protein